MVGDVPGGPVGFKMLHFQCKGMGLILGRGTRIPCLVVIRVKTTTTTAAANK